MFPDPVGPSIYAYKILHRSFSVLYFFLHVKPLITETSNWSSLKEQMNIKRKLRKEIRLESQTLDSGA